MDILNNGDIEDNETIDGRLVKDDAKVIMPNNQIEDVNKFSVFRSVTTPLTQANDVCMGSLHDFLTLIGLDDSVPFPILPNGEIPCPPFDRPFGDFKPPPDYKSRWGFYYNSFGNIDRLLSYKWPREWQSKENYMILLLFLYICSDDLHHSGDKSDKQLEDIKWYLDSVETGINSLIDVESTTEAIQTNNEYSEAHGRYQESSFAYEESLDAVREEENRFRSEHNMSSEESIPFPDDGLARAIDASESARVEYQNAYSELSHLKKDIVDPIVVRRRSELKGIFNCDTMPTNDFPMEYFTGTVLDELNYYKSKVTYQ